MNSKQTWYTVFFKNGYVIINNGARFDSVENLLKDFPQAAIIPTEKVPEKWKYCSVEKNELVPASAKEIDFRAAIEIAEKQAKIREERDKLIKETDYLVLPDYPLSNDERSAVLKYRQSLRDITLQDTFASGLVKFPGYPILQRMQSV